MSQELIARIEAATGPDREIDRAIMELLCLAPDYAADWGGRGFERPAPFAYTASIDAALTLVPDGHDKWAVSGRNAAVVQSSNKEVTHAEWMYAATPALALCAAALKARLV